MKKPDPSSPAPAPRRLLLVLVAVSVLFAVLSVAARDPVGAVLWTAAAAFWFWFSRRTPTAARPVPPHVDEQWGQRVLAEAGDPVGVAAVKALRQAEPALSLLDAKRLVDRLGAWS